MAWNAKETVVKLDSGLLPPINAPVLSLTGAPELAYEPGPILPESPESAVQAVILEYGWAGWSCDQIAHLFQDPYYPLLNELWYTLGETGVHELVVSTLRHTGLLRMQASTGLSHGHDSALGLGG